MMGTVQRLVGYTDRLVAHPGDRVPLRVSSPASWSARLVRLWHEQEEDIASPLDGARFPAAEHPITRGSWLEVPGAGELPPAGTFAVWVFLTRASPGGTLFAGGGTRVGLDADGRLELAAGDVRVRTERPVPVREWRLVAASWDDNGAVRAAHGPATASRVPADVASSDDARLSAQDRRAADELAPTAPTAWRIGQGVDGKLGRPALYASLIGLTALDTRLAGPGPATGDTLYAAWDLAADPAGAGVPDTGPHGLHGELHGMPTRAVTSHDWTGDEDAWRHSPHQWSAVHVHTDDLEDAGWPAAAELALPDDLPSGLYAARLGAENGAADHVPIVVAPRAPGARVAVVLPTFTYRAYANEAISADFDVVTRGDADARVTADGLLSQYNRHADGSGVVHASARRPLLGVRPDHVYWLTGQPHGLGADLHLLTWLRDEGVPVDVLTDELVHERGAALLEPYRVVITGSHHEYVTREQQRALRAYRDGGGRMMVLGGNCLQLVCAVHRDRPWVTEVRRTGSHVGLWQGDPGETHLAATGEPGGHWALRKETPRTLTGLDLSGMGFSGARPYTRTPRSREPDVGWIFDGVPDGPIGTAGLVMGGAAGYEVDAFDVRAGSPADGIVLATARDFGPDYVAAGADPEIRADMVLLPARNDGWVFAVGSITWCGALLLDPAVGRVTANVLRRFSAGTRGA